MAKKNTLENATGREMGCVVVAVLLILELTTMINEDYGVIGALAAVFATIIMPKVFLPLYRAWMKLAFLLSFVFSPIIMGALFFIAFAPTGIMLRLLKKDLLSISRANLTKKTFWKDKDSTIEGGMKRQF